MPDARRAIPRVDQYSAQLNDRFDLVWLFAPDPPGGGPLHLRQVPQLLLAGDNTELIA